MRACSQYLAGNPVDHRLGPLKRFVDQAAGEACAQTRRAHVRISIPLLRLVGDNEDDAGGGTEWVYTQDRARDTRALGAATTFDTHRPDAKLSSALGGYGGSLE